MDLAALLDAAAILAPLRDDPSGGPLRLVATAAAVGAVAAFLRLGPFPLVATAFHEVGHALAGLSVGAPVRGIHLHRDATGFTVWGERRGLGVRLRRSYVAWWGYPAPTAAAALGSWAAHAGHARTWVAVLGAASVVVLVVWSRNWWAVVTAVAASLVLIAAALGPAIAAGSLVGLLGGAGLRATFDHVRVPARRGGPSDTEVIMSALGVVPAALVHTSFVAAALGAAALATAALT